VRQQTATAKSPAALLKRYVDALGEVLSRMPGDPADLLTFFDNAERVFKDTHTHTYIYIYIHTYIHIYTCQLHSAIINALFE